MRDGWSIKDAGRVLDIHPNKVTQAIGPAFLKVARLMDADARATAAELLAALEQVQQERFEEVELANRERMATNRMDRSELHPRVSRG